jgi:hypothetical protein
LGKKLLKEHFAKSASQIPRDFEIKFAEVCSVNEKIVKNITYRNFGN